MASGLGSMPSGALGTNRAMRAQKSTNTWTSGTRNRGDRNATATAPDAITATMTANAAPNHPPSTNRGDRASAPSRTAMVLAPVGRIRARGVVIGACAGAADSGEAVGGAAVVVTGHLRH